MTDPRRAVPRTDTVLADARIVAASGRLGRAEVKAAVVAALDEVRHGRLPAADAVDDALRRLPSPPRRVVNATGVALHTNLGRAALSTAAREAMDEAAGYTDVEFDLASGQRATRGRGALATLHAAVRDADAALIVNNGAAALALAAVTLAAGREIVVSRGEMVEIGDGFRLPDLIESTGARLREVGTTNRVTVADYERAVTADTGAILKVHPSNFRVEGFTSAVPVSALCRLAPPVVADIGSGLLAPHPLLPDEPDVTSTLRAGASVVTCSGDKLLGGPQAGLVFGDATILERLRRHPMYRAFRVDKLTLAALEATVRGGGTPTWQALTADPDELRRRCDALADTLAAAVGATVVASDGAVGGGSAPGTALPGWAVAVDPALAVPLRTGTPAVVGRVHDGRLLLDLRCVDPADDELVADAVSRACG